MPGARSTNADLISGNVPVAGGECLVYAVVADPATLIVERVTRLERARPRLPRRLRSWAGRRWLWPRS